MTRTGRTRVPCVPAYCWPAQPRDDRARAVSVIEPQRNSAGKFPQRAVMLLASYRGLTGPITRIYGPESLICFGLLTETFSDRMDRIGARPQGRRDGTWQRSVGP